MFSEDVVKTRLSILFFMRIFGELDHWYHLFVAIYYNVFSAFSRRDIIQINHIHFVYFADSRHYNHFSLDMTGAYMI